MKTMLSRSLFVVTLISLSQLSLAHDLQQPTQKDNAVTGPIYKLFDAMREHDQDKILAQFTSKALLQRITTKGEITNTDVKKFALSISTNTAELDEHLLAVIINQQNELASVWTPFAFYLNDKLSHCGSNSFQLVQINGEWKIHYLIDVTYTGDCQAFVDKYKIQ
ncbi:hypothetical protein [Paraglaciecola arctica]|uniref:DUF4440 domain-containing protein n=1 Tax=Paraglaciecola arctica BSs20135 TaxID=493475 RepID=K6X955_9ALTE|nr:hypothetical protein [Paraglaciecola arctica]GAC17164.1 hypothetical protein GARC_0182 [Paraglaciecola arctica BSs20135]